MRHDLTLKEAMDALLKSSCFPSPKYGIVANYMYSFNMTKLKENGFDLNFKWYGCFQKILKTLNEPVDGMTRVQAIELYGFPDYAFLITKYKPKNKIIHNNGKVHLAETGSCLGASYNILSGYFREQAKLQSKGQDSLKQEAESLERDSPVRMKYKTPNLI